MSTEVQTISPAAATSTVPSAPPATDAAAPVASPPGATNGSAVVPSTDNHQPEPTTTTSAPTEKATTEPAKIRIDTTLSSKECFHTLVPPFSQMMADSFTTDPVLRYMLYPAFPNEDAKNAYLVSWFTALFRAAALNKCVFDVANEFSSGAVWVPPDGAVDKNLLTWIPAGFLGMGMKVGLTGLKRMLIEFQQKMNSIKSKALEKKEKFWYLWFIATKPESRGQGLSSALIKKYQAVAEREGLPIWLEATTEGSHRLYGKLGFKDVADMSLGKGKADKDGRPEKGGPGVKIWAMIWRPEAKQTEKVQ